MKILLDFNAIIGTRFYKPTIGYESTQSVPDNGVGIINFAASKNLIVKSTQCSQTTTFINTLGLLMGKCTD
jgi:hypothetical protein